MLSSAPSQRETLGDQDDDDLFDNTFCLSSHMLNVFVDPEPEYAEESVDNLDETFHTLHHRSGAMSAALDDLAAKNGLFFMASYLASKLPYVSILALK